MTTHRSYRGAQIDMSGIVEKNSDTIAIGNAGVNARGDKIGEGGTIIRTAEEIARERNRTITSVKASSLKDEPPKVENINTDALRQTRTKPTKPAKTTSSEKELDNGDIVVDEFGGPNAD